ncbi:MAG: glycine cleavage protein T [Zetaproteobacteria bacterium]|nr:MAG: glycine cleavage protein T [Zetaproteobacteria bacterium]
MTQTPFYTRLKKRGKIIISGADRKDFIQNLMSNDINLLNTQACIYSCLLTPQGKFLYDFFITEEKDTLTLECEGDDRTEDLAKILTMYKLRANITIEINKDVTTYAIIGDDTFGDKDPRHIDMGYRSSTKPTQIPEQPFEYWDKHRIALTIPDGSRDMIPQKSTLLECNIDKLNGLSYEKGCYIGQELTARMHYRGLAKKHLQTVRLDTLPDKAELRSSCGDIGIALVKTK